MKTTGLDKAALIPVGATLTDAYWTVAPKHGRDQGHATQAEAIAEGLAYQQGLVDRHNAANQASGYHYPHPESFAVDLRWTLTYPAGGGLDTVIERFTYESLADAQAHLDRIAKYAGV